MLLLYPTLFKIKNHKLLIKKYKFKDENDTDQKVLVHICC